MIPASFFQMGVAFVDFGKALQNPATRIDELVRLADAAGIELQFNVKSTTEDCANG